MNRITNFFKALVDNWVLAKDEPAAVQPGEVHYIAPGGKLEISAVLENGNDVAEVKQVIDILLSRGERRPLDRDEFLSLGVTE